MTKDIMFDFRGRSVAVTGAARGIGLEIARFFADAGAVTYMLDSDGAEVLTAAAAMGATGLRVDVSSTSDVDAAVSRIISDTGCVDVIVNNAGILRDSVLWKMDDDAWDSVLAVHVGGTFRLTRACVPHFRSRQRGRVINVTSYTGMHGMIGQANYAAAKAGIIGFTKTAAKELARFGITVNAISPNASTRMVESIPAAKRAELTASIPMGRFAAAAEMSAAVGFLASDAASYITGIVLPVDGGLSI